MHSRGVSRWLLVGSGIAAVCILSAACSEPPATFEVKGKIGGTADNVHASGSCQYGDTWYHHGDDVVLWGFDNTVLAADHLVAGPDTRPGAPGVCDLTFHFNDVRPGDVAYQLSVGASRKIILTEDQLNTNGFELIPRATANNDDPDIRVITTESSTPGPKP